MNTRSSLAMAVWTYTLGNLTTASLHHGYSTFHSCAGFFEGGEVPQTLHCQRLPGEFLHAGKDFGTHLLNLGPDRHKLFYSCRCILRVLCSIHRSEQGWHLKLVIIIYLHWDCSSNLQSHSVLLCWRSILKQFD